jgi:hypothetical protein
MPWRDEETILACASLREASSCQARPTSACAGLESFEQARTSAIGS